MCDAVTSKLQVYISNLSSWNLKSLHIFLEESRLSNECYVLFRSRWCSFFSDQTLKTECNCRHAVLWKHMVKWETRRRKTNSHTGVTWEQDLVLFYKQSHLSNVFRDTASRRTGISYRKKVLTQRLAGKRYLLKNPKKLPSLHPGCTMVDQEMCCHQILGKKSSFPWHWARIHATFLGPEALGLAQMIWGGVGSVGKSGGSSMHLPSVSCPCQCPWLLSHYDGRVG